MFKSGTMKVAASGCQSARVGAARGHARGQAGPSQGLAMLSIVIVAAPESRGEPRWRGIVSVTVSQRDGSPTPGQEGGTEVRQTAAPPALHPFSTSIASSSKHLFSTYCVRAWAGAPLGDLALGQCRGRPDPEGLTSGGSLRPEPSGPSPGPSPPLALRAAARPGSCRWPLSGPAGLGL